MNVNCLDSMPEVTRVLHVVGGMNVGGAETLLMNLYRGVDRSRIQFDFLVYTDEPGVYDKEIAALGGRVLRTQSSFLRRRRAGVRAIRTVLREEGPFIAVHAHVLHGSAFAVRAAHAEGIPIRITHSHSTGDVGGGMIRKFYVAWSRREIVRKSTALVACGGDAGRYLFGERDWTFLRNGVSLTEFRPLPAEVRAAVRAELGVAPEVPFIGVVARFEAVKNHAFLLHVATVLRGRGVPFRIAFAGEGSLQHMLEAAVRSDGLEDYVSFLGLRRDTPQLMSAFDVLAMPSLYEGIPVVLMEAQAAGLPCLVSLAVSSEADLSLGLVRFLPVDSAEAWADAIEALPSRAGSEDHQRWSSSVRRQGADIEESVDLLYDLYGVETA